MVRASLAGFAGLLVGLIPLLLSIVLIQFLSGDGASATIAEGVLLAVGVTGFLFAGVLAGAVAAWRLRPAGSRGQRAAGQLAVFLLEVLVVGLLIATNPTPDSQAPCGLLCDAGRDVLAGLAILGWPVAAVGALIGAAFVRRRINGKRALSEFSQRSQ